MAGHGLTNLTNLNNLYSTSAALKQFNYIYIKQS